MKASGNLGPSILDQLLKQLFEVTVLSRQGSNHTFPPSVQVLRVDYSSQDSLVSALHGQDAVVSTMATLALDSQLPLIEAAAAAGVRRFIPSEFGSDTSNPKCAALPVFQKKLMIQKALQDWAAKNTGLSHTIICTGPFLDWGLTKGFMNIKDKRVSLYDGGDRVYSTTTLPTIGRAICGVLMHPEETKNRIVKVHDIATTQNKLFTMAQKEVGSEGWTINKPSINAMLEQSWTEFKQGKRDLHTMLGFIVTASWGEGYGGHFEQTDNDLLGIPEMTDEELQAVINGLAE